MKFFLILIFIAFTGCKAINNKTEELVKKENEKLGKFLNQPLTELKIVFGNPNNITNNENGTKSYIYIKKKYNISCKRVFEINEKNMVVGFTSKGCF